MIQKLKSKLAIFASVIVLAVPVLAPTAIVAAAPAVGGNNSLIDNNLCKGSNFDVTASPGSQADCPASDDNGINGLLQKAVNIISAIVGVIAVIMIVVGGFKYITSGGESSNVSGAKNTIIYAIIGLIIVALAQVIVHFVLNQSNTLTN
jgi:hypothetical protein